MGHVAGLVATDAAYRRDKKEREARLPLILVQNQVTKIILQLDDPKDALTVIERMARSIREHIDAQARGLI